ncbi:hypothetical protein PDE_06303 [Penicillium oxalicum 114-2]|uniref:Uncharacterized protein n=1 Tax=Penicillium oxalicum (strain 114-2 / CGMCC 5302) TaxID=933388 RepID=S8AYC9_PENO1|nr:hypothetical protein PDE_06303 [Penicillium oxalicum 114-2]
MSSVYEASKPFKHTWKSLPDTCKNYRCITENWDEWSERKTYLECDALDLNGNWKKSRFHLDEFVKFTRDDLIFLTTPNYNSATLSSNLVEPHPRVTMMNGQLELTAHGHGHKGSIWRTVTLRQLMNEDGVVFGGASGLSPKGLVVRLAWMKADKAKEEAERVRKEEERNGLLPYWNEEWLEFHNKELKALEEMRRTLPSTEGDWLDVRLSEVKVLIANIPDMPNGWSSKKFDELTEKERKAVEEAERKRLEPVWRKWKENILKTEVERAKGSVKIFEDSPRHLDTLEIMRRNLRVAEENLRRLRYQTMPEGWKPEPKKSEAEMKKLEESYREWWLKKTREYLHTYEITRYYAKGKTDEEIARLDRKIEETREELKNVPKMPYDWTGS